MDHPSQTSQPRPKPLKACVVAPPEPRWMVLVMLFVLAGALAVPMLWRSPHFSRPTKIVLSVLAAIQTAVVLVILAFVVTGFVERVSAILTRY
ncbi:MAG: hypothetical protein JW719_03715 [Pirellulales bacterium]|nr:hypothetical protein [Pirellulales bacterium]